MNTSYCKSILLTLLFFSITISADNWQIDNQIPLYYHKQLSNKIESIKTNKGCSFVFITDTHVSANVMLSPYLIREIVRATPVKNVIWGGDAIVAFGTNSSIDTQWKRQSLLDSLLLGIGHLYKIRGNHDYTIRESRVSDLGITYSQPKTAQLLFENHPDGIVRNRKDLGGCYYYFDDKSARVRFVVFDTTDSVHGENIAWGTAYGVHDVQMKWIADSAIATTPKGYGLIFFSHVPFTDTTGARHMVLSNVKEIVDAAASQSSGRVGTVKYDFTKLDDVKVLMCLSGHNHQDMQTFRKGVVHMVTACDAAYDDYMTDPFVSKRPNLGPG